MTSLGLGGWGGSNYQGKWTWIYNSITNKPRDGGGRTCGSVRILGKWFCITGMEEEHNSLRSCKTGNEHRKALDKRIRWDAEQMTDASDLLPALRFPAPLPVV